MIAEAAVMEGPAEAAAALDLDRTASVPEGNLPLAGAKPRSGSQEEGLPPDQGRGVADSATATEETEQDRPGRVPSSRNREIYRQVKILERSERDVAREYGLTQPRIFAICKQVRLWNEENGGNRPDQSPQASHNLAVANARLRLSHTFSQAAKWLEVSGQPPLSEPIKPGETSGDVVKKAPNPKPAFVGHMLKAAIELAKLEGAYDPPPRQDIASSAGRESPPAATQEEVVVVTSPPKPMTLKQFEQARREASHYTPSEEVLSARGAAMAFAHVPEFRDERAKDLRAAGFDEISVLDVAARRHLQAENNYYRAVAEAHAPPGDPEGPDRLVDMLVDLDIVAAQADALAWNDVLLRPRPEEKERAQAAPEVHEEVARKRLYYLEAVLRWDYAGVDMTDKSYDAVMDRYRPEAGCFDWQLDTGRPDLASLLLQRWQIEEEEEEVEEEADEDEQTADEDRETDDETDGEERAE